MTEVPPLESISPLRETVLELLPAHEQDFWSCSEVMPEQGFVVRIVDPVWGELVINPPASYLFTAPAFVRTANVKQLSTTRFLFEGATHARLGHQMGVYYIVSSVYEKLVEAKELKQLSKKIIRKRIKTEWNHLLRTDEAENILEKYLDDTNYEKIYNIIIKMLGKELVGLSGLLHDIGHGGWGHVFDALNGLIFRMLQEAHERGAFGSRGFLSQSLLEIQKLDITSATYVITSSEQIRLSIRDGIRDLINSQNKTTIQAQNNLEQRVWETVKELNDGFHLLDIIITIISEDITITRTNGRLHNKALAWHQRAETETIENLVLFSVIAEMLYIIAQLGIQLLGDLDLRKSPCNNNESSKAGINGDRLDWIPRDIYYLGNSVEIDKQKYEKLREHIKNLLNNPSEYLEIKFDDNKGFLLLCHKEPMIELANLVGALRGQLYNHVYHDTRKALFDSVLVRAGYSSINLIRSVINTIFTRDLTLRLGISYLLNNDELFINDSIKTLRSATGSPASHLLIRLHEVDKKLFNTNLISKNLINIIKSIYNNYQKLCDANCKDLLNFAYTIQTATPTFVKILNQPFLLTQLTKDNDYFYITSPYPTYFNKKNLIYSKIFSLKDLINKYNSFDENNKIIEFIRFLENPDECQEYIENLKELFRDFSEDLMTLNIPLIEYIIKRVIVNRHPLINNIYLNYIHYAFKSMISRLDKCKEARENWLNDVFNMPLFPVLISTTASLTGDAPRQEQLQRIQNEIKIIEDEILTIISYILITMLLERVDKLDIL